MVCKPGGTRMTCSFKSSKQSATMICNGVYIFLIIEALIPAITSLVCGKPAYFDTRQGSRLLNSMIEKIAVYALDDCLNKCTEKKGLCLSINFQHGNDDVKQCYLNNSTRHSAPAENFQSNPGFTYYEIDRIGWSSNKPGKSCKDIKSRGDGLHNGKYWIDPEGSGNAMQVYCDMSHEGGGWLLVSNVVIPDAASIPSLTTMRTSYRDIVDYNNGKTIISATALGQLRQHIKFAQLRFQCRQASVGRTVHVITAANSKGSDVVNYYTAASNTPPQACDSFYRGAGDNSRLAAQCSQWKNGGWSSSSRVNEWRLHDHTFYVPNKYHWHTKSPFRCDSGNSDNVYGPGDFWKIYVR